MASRVKTDGLIASLGRLTKSPHPPHTHTHIFPSIISSLQLCAELEEIENVSVLIFIFKSNMPDET